MSRQASGLMAWLAQRATAIYLALFATYLLLHFIFFGPATHAELVEWLSRPLPAIGILLFIPVITVHAWVGIRDVLIDYVHIVSLRVALMSLFVFVFTASGLGAVKALFLASAGIGE